MNKLSLVIIGATSAIAEKISRLYAEQGASLFLVGRNEDKLKTIANDLLVRGASNVGYMTADVTNFSMHPEILKTAIQQLGEITHLYMAYGTLPDQSACELRPELAVNEITLNLNSNVSLLLYFADFFEKQKKGIMVVLSSVAGDRGRQSNYIYGAAKGGLTVFLQGLRNRLFPSNVRVITVKPGFVDTPMTKDFEKGFLWVSADKVAKHIVSKVSGSKDIIYVPGFWRLIMLIIIHIPEFVFKRLKL